MPEAGLKPNNLGISGPMCNRLCQRANHVTASTHVYTHHNIIFYKDKYVFHALNYLINFASNLHKFVVTCFIDISSLALYIQVADKH